MIVDKIFAFLLGVAVAGIACGLQDNGCPLWVTIICILIASLLITWSLFPVLKKFDNGEVKDNE